MKERVEAYLKQLMDKKAWWEFKIQHSVWVDDGYGNSVNKYNMLIIVKGKIEAVNHILRMF